jgi:AbrB family looped-hinge helix DNA binding protein
VVRLGMADTHIAVLSSKGQIVIPKNIRDALGLREGAKLEVALEGHRVVLRTIGPVDQTTSEILAEGRREEFEKERRLLEHLSICKKISVAMKPFLA